DQGRGNVTTDRTTQYPDGTNTAEKRVDDGKGNVTNYRITKKPDGTTELSDRNRLWPGVDRYREHEIVSKMSEGNPGAASVLLEYLRNPRNARFEDRSNMSRESQLLDFARSFEGRNSVLDFNYVRMLDRRGIYGAKIYEL